jgi:hypothetical protein
MALEAERERARESSVQDKKFAGTQFSGTGEPKKKYNRYNQRFSTKTSSGTS